MVYRRRLLVFTLGLWLVAGTSPAARTAQAPAAEPNLTDEQKREFLLNAKVIKSKQIGKGITNPWRLTLSDGALTHDAAFQSIDERKNLVRFARGPSEIGFRDSYHFNIAAYELAKLLGLDDMVPVTVERTWKGEAGALSWWIPSKWDEEARRKLNLVPRDMQLWGRQIANVEVFAALIYDTDRNQGNLLITEDWRLWMIDFTRAFRRHPNLQRPEALLRCDPRLFDRLRRLNAKEVLERTTLHLNPGDVKVLLIRRDKIVQHFQRLIAEQGEAAVLY